MAPRQWCQVITAIKPAYLCCDGGAGVRSLRNRGSEARGDHADSSSTERGLHCTVVLVVLVVVSVDLF